MDVVKPDIFLQRMNILIYGDPGAGKTHLAGTAQDHPLMANVHVFNIDGGLLTLASRGDIRASDISSVDDLENEMWKIASGHSDYEDINTIVIDNITELQTLSLEEITRKEVLTNTTRQNRGATIDDVYLEDYGKSTTQLSRVLRGFRDLPLNKIYIAHKKDKMRGNSSVVESTVPSLTNKLGTAVSGYMDFVWYLYHATEDVVNESGDTHSELHRYLLTQTYDVYFAKTRGQRFADRLGSVIRDPNMAEIFDLYMETHNLND